MVIFINNSAEWINLLAPLKDPTKILIAIGVLVGIIAVGKLFWMVVYELKYYHGAGQDYLDYGKNYYKFKIYQYWHGVGKI